MSGLWIVPAMVLLVGTVVVAGLLRGLARAAADLRAEMARVGDLVPAAASLREEAAGLRRAVARSPHH